MVKAYMWIYTATDRSGFVNVYNSHLIESEDDAHDQVIEDIEQLFEQPLSDLFNDGTVSKWEDDLVYVGVNGPVLRHWNVIEVSDQPGTGTDSEFQF